MGLNDGRSRAPVLFISTNDATPWGGSEELWFETALRMANDGWPVIASVFKWPNRAAQLSTLEAANVKVLEHGSIGIVSRLWHKAFPVQDHAWLGKLQPRPCFAFVSQGVNFDQATIDVGETLLEQRVPYAIVSQSAFPWFWPADGLAIRSGNVLKRAAASYFVSDMNLRLTRAQVGDPLSNGRVIRNPFHVDYDQPIPYPRGDVMKLACVGRLEPSVKGQDLLLEALSSDIWKNRPLHVTFYGSGPNGEIIKRMQRAFDVRNATFGGHIPPQEIWRDNHALVLSSRAEGLPIVVVEAMLSGRICIVTDAGGNSEVIEDGVTGFIARDISAAGIRNALERAWERRGEWQAMGEWAAESIRQKVPRDPAGCLKQELEALINGEQLSLIPVPLNGDATAGPSLRSCRG